MSMYFRVSITSPLPAKVNKKTSVFYMCCQTYLRWEGCCVFVPVTHSEEPPLCDCPKQIKILIQQFFFYGE